MVPVGFTNQLPPKRRVAHCFCTSQDVVSEWTYSLCTPHPKYASPMIYLALALMLLPKCTMIMQPWSTLSLHYRCFQISHWPSIALQTQSWLCPYKLDLAILATCFIGSTSKCPCIISNPLGMSFANKIIVHVFSTRIYIHSSNFSLYLPNLCNMPSESLHNRNPHTQQNNPLQNTKNHTYHKSTKKKKWAYTTQIFPYNQNYSNLQNHSTHKTMHK